MQSGKSSTRRFHRDTVVDVDRPSALSSSRTTITVTPGVETERGQVAPGDIVDSSYRIVSCLGKGAMGVVWRAHDLRLDRDVALKVMRPANFRLPHLRDQFEQEARALARVRHANVVEVFAFGYLGDAPYFVMEYVDGVDLNRWAQTRGSPLSLKDTLAVLDPLCRGVHAVHAVGAVHRDIKPGNVLVSSAFRIALADLGLARPFDDLQIRGQGLAIGTPGYMAPEVIAELAVPSRLAARADVYALGVVAFELLTGRGPFRGSTTAALLRAQVDDTPTPLSELRPDLPATLQHAIQACLHKDPGERLESAEAFRVALERARPPVAPTRPARVLPARVLVVDDDTGHAQLLALLIRRHGLAVEEVDNGKEAIARARAAPPDLVITDLHMPTVGGADVVAALKRDPRTRDVPVVVVTGFGGALDWVELKRLGAAGFLVKPVDPEQLLPMVLRLTKTEPSPR